MALIMGVGWYARRGTPRLAATGNAGWHPQAAIRRDWPGTGHDFVALGISSGAAQAWIARDAAYWRKGPILPAYSLVEISDRDFRLHNRHRLSCTAPDCPTADAALDPAEPEAVV